MKVWYTVFERKLKKHLIINYENIILKVLFFSFIPIVLYAKSNYFNEDLDYIIKNLKLKSEI